MPRLGAGRAVRGPEAPTSAVGDGRDVEGGWLVWHSGLRNGPLAY
jgi:hypothetical protein